MKRSNGRGRSWTASARSVARTGFGSAIAISRCMSSAPCRLRLGQTLSEVTADICRRLGIGARVVPMSDDRVRTRVRSDTDWIDFQDYFVRQQCRPVVHELAFDGVTLARPHADITTALRSGDLRAVIVCPSNPFIIEPTVIRQPGIAMDIDHPVDLALFLRLPQSAGTRTRTLLDELGVPALLAKRGIA